MRGTNGGLRWLALAILLIFVSSILHVGEVTVVCLVAGIILGIWGVVQMLAGTRSDEDEAPLVDGGNQIVLFPKSEVPDGFLSCPHCGEPYGFGITICPRCGRDRSA
jgi:hypothetical protein